MKGIFEVRINHETIQYEHFDDIPQKFDNLIRFEPEYPESPHSQEDHELVEAFGDKLVELMLREQK